MRLFFGFFWVLVTLVFSEEEKQGAKSSEQGGSESVSGHVFAWGFLESKEMQPQGGMTQGASVVLDQTNPPNWKSLQETPNGFEKDRKAILAMAGDYRVSFDFTEIMGFSEGYKPPNPYFSWGTEHVKVLEDQKDFISLQHTLVMFFKDEKGDESGPFLVKHWRQDWRFEDCDLHTYRGFSTWKRKRLQKKEAKGAWTQAVYQVDDSPRYEVLGRWHHEGGVSTWKSGTAWRPLPRREFSVRDDYNVLSGSHEITIVPTGWVHVQNNQKILLSKAGSRKVIGQELGVNRYERISEPSLSAAEESWAKVGPYWNEVRAVWDEILRSRDAFTLKDAVDQKRLYQKHFSFAADVEESGYDSDLGKEHARSTIEKFLAPNPDPTSADY